MKGFCGHRIETKSRMLGGEQPIEIAQKMRDSVAGMVGIFHTMNDADRWRPFQLLCDAQKEVHIVIWLEYWLPQYPTKREKVRHSVSVEVFKKKRWLTTKVLVVNARTGSLPGVVLKNVPLGS